MTSKIVSSGVTSSGIDIGSGGLLTILSGGTADSSTLRAAATEIISAGGLGSVATVAGGYQEVYGTADATVVRAGTLSGVSYQGLQVVSSGGYAGGVTISNGGFEQLVAGGVASGVVISKGGGQEVDSGGSAQAVVVSSGGDEQVSSGALVSGLTVDSGGTIILYAGAIIEALTSEGGGIIDETVPAGAEASGFDVTISADQVVEHHGSAYDTMAVGGGQYVSGRTNNTTLSGLTVTSGSGHRLYNGDQVVFSGGEAVSVTISSGGVASISSGGEIADADVYGGGFLEVGGLAKSVVGSSGAYILFESGAVVSGARISSGATVFISAGATYSNLVVASGASEIVQQIVSSGETSSGLFVSAGGYQDVLSGGVAVGTTVEGETAYQDVAGVASNAAIYYGTQVISKGAMAYDTLLDCIYNEDGAYVSQSIYGSAIGLTISFQSNSSPTFTNVYSGGYVSGLTDEFGYIDVASGAELRNVTATVSNPVRQAGLL